MSEESARRIAMVIQSGVTPLSVIGPLQVFAYTNFTAKRKLYDILTIGATGVAVQTSQGFAMLPTIALQDLDGPIDTLLVAGLADVSALQDGPTRDWLSRTAPTVRRYGSVCTGAFVLAAAGLIEHKRATTHWAFAAELKRRCPSAHIDIDALFVRDGALCTSGGLSAGIDMALALVEEDYGRKLALDVARGLVLFRQRSGGQAQFSTQLRTQMSSMPALRGVQLWCLDNLAGNLQIDVLAARAGMSERSFARKFTDDTGEAPAEFILSARFQEACRLLEQTRLPLQDIAQRCGVGSMTALQRLFRRRIGVTPSRYRNEFTTGTALADHDAPGPAALGQSM
ncbi:MAG: GlxA family transcriptional regulator [Beijerinckiaceae bacterium]